MFADNKHIIFKSDNQIIIFDSKGKYVNKIDAEGQGPEEYTTICSAYFDPIEEYIYIVEWENIKIFSINGKFIRSLKMPFSGGLFRKSNGEMIVVYSQSYNKENRAMLSLLDSSLKIFHSFKSKNPDVCKDVEQNLFVDVSPYEINGRVYFKEPFVDTIFEITDTLLTPHWNINMGEIGLKTKDGINSSNRKKASDKINPILSETENYIFIKYTYNHTIYTSLYDKQHEKFIFHQKYDNDVSFYGLKNDLIKQAPLFWPNYKNGNLVVNIVNPSLLNEDQLKELNCEAEDNPILIIGILK